MSKIHSLSTVMLLSAGALALASLLSIFPWSSWIISEKSFLQQAQLIVGAGAIIWVVLFFLLVQYFKMRTDKKRLNDLENTTTLLNLSQETSLQSHLFRLRKMSAFERSEYRVVGNVEKVQDDGGPLKDSPIAFRVQKRNVVVIPALWWKRYLKYPDALTALLAHETAHFENRDFALLFGMKHLLLIIAAVICVYIPLTLATSIFADAPHFWEWSAFQAAVVGKNYLIANFILLVAIVIVVQKLRDWREALADFVAVQICGEQALLQSEALLQSSEPSLQPKLQTSHEKTIDGSPPRSQRLQALSLTHRDMLIFGFIAQAITDYAMSPLAYMSQILQKNVDVAISFFMPLLLYVLFFFALVAIMRDSSVNSLNVAKRAGQKALLLVVGAALGFLLLQMLPLFITSIGMPEGYDYVMRHDPWPLLLSSIAGSMTSPASIALLAMLGAWISTKTDHLWLGIIPGLCWAASSTVEVFWIPSLLEGWLAVLVTASVTIFIFVVNRIEVRTLLHPGIATLLPIIALSVAAWLGYGDVGHFAACSSHAGLEKRDAGEVDGAIDSFRRAAERSWLHPDGWMDLAKELSHDEANLREAADMAERATTAIYLSSWQKRFETLRIAGHIRLQLRTSSDLAIAASHYAHAEALWHHNSRMPYDQVAYMLYNQACIFALQNEDVLEATLRLIEATAIASTIAVKGNLEVLANVIHALNDPDLVLLKLKEQPPPTQATVQKILENEASAPVLRKAVREEQLSPTELRRFLAWKLKHYKKELFQLQRN
jgi:hypothetical protein